MNYIDLKLQEADYSKLDKIRKEVMSKEKKGKEKYYGEDVETIVWQIQIRKDKQVEMKEAINAVRKTFKNV